MNRPLPEACRRLLPFLMTAAGIVEADRIIDVQTLAWPVLAAIGAAVACILNDYATRRSTAR